MSELQTLFAVLVVFYLLQCVAWIPQDSAAFRPALLGGWMQAGEGFRVESEHIRGVPGNPLPPLHGVVVCQPALAAVSPQGVASTAGRRQAFAAFAGMEEVTAHGKSVSMGKEVFLKAGSAGDATRLAAWLEKLRTMPEKKRGGAIEKRLAASLDEKLAAERFAEFHGGTAWLGWTCTGLFSFLFVFLPLTVDAVGLARVWPALLAVLVVLVATVAWQFRRAHLVLFPGQRDARWSAFMTILLSPVAAVRAQDGLTRELFAEFHPLAVARVLCAAEEYRRVAARTLREFTWPIPGSVGEQKDERAAQCEAWYRERLGAAMQRALEDAGAEPEELLAPPEPSGPQSAAYCPRCCQQYAVASGACADCGGIPLEPLERALEKSSSN